MMGTPIALGRGMDKNKRRLLLNLRRGVRLKRRLVAIGSEGAAVSYRCLTCGAKSTTEYPTENAATMMRRWHGEENGGCSGTCQPCLKALKDRLYPLGSPK